MTHRHARAASQEDLIVHDLRPHLCRDDVTEVAVNDPGRVWVMDGDGWHEHVAPNLTFQKLEIIARDIVNGTGQDTGPAATLIAGSLLTKERVQVIRPPAVPDETISITIRKPPGKSWTPEELEARGMFPPPASVTRAGAEPTPSSWLSAAKIRDLAQSRLNVLFSGAPGSGKTSLMGAMADGIPLDQRIITIEDVRELRLPHRNVVSLSYSRGGQGTDKSTALSLLEACLRMAPHRVLLAEIRGGKAFAYMRVMNSGLHGSLSSLHASSAQKALLALRSMVLQSPEGAALGPAEATRMIKELIDLVIHVEKLPDGRRVVTEIYDPKRKAVEPRG